MDTTTSYLGFRLPHPFIAGASPLGWHVDGVRRLEDAGCAAVVLHSLFEEQITTALDGRIRQRDVVDRSFDDVLRQFPAATEYPHGPDAYAEHIARVKEAVRIPVIGSLNGTSAESWLRFARVIEQAGADGIELNLYEVVADTTVSGAALEHQLTHIVEDLKRMLKIPVAIKLSPFFTALANVARRLDDAGANALVLFNRFYQPDIDVATCSPLPQLELSTAAELPLRLRWIAILHGKVRAALALTGGIAGPNDGVKAILAGADVVQMVSALLRHGPNYVSVMVQALQRWMEWNKLTHLDDMRGRSSLKNTSEPAAFERANYIRTLQSWSR
jgi:dihydroorotate dehydrogenase (fumarate)